MIDADQSVILKGSLMTKTVPRKERQMERRQRKASGMIWGLRSRKQR